MTFIVLLVEQIDRTGADVYYYDDNSILFKTNSLDLCLFVKRQPYGYVLCNAGENNGISFGIDFVAVLDHLQNLFDIEEGE